MGRAALTGKVKILCISIAVIIVAIGIIWAAIAHSPSHMVTASYGTSHQLSQISYHGQNGVSALTLLERHAQVQVKHYSFGDMVEAINGAKGDGPKYWLFYVNGKEANSGAGSYMTNNGELITWKLQS
jgi:hypothetical protein